MGFLNQIVQEQVNCKEFTIQDLSYSDASVSSTLPYQYLHYFGIDLLLMNSLPCSRELKTPYDCSVLKIKYIFLHLGYGIFIQTAVGETLVNMTEVTDNWGDGIKFYISNLTIHDFQKNFTWNMGFCNTNNVVGQSYPIFQHQDIIGPNGEKTSATKCERVSI